MKRKLKTPQAERIHLCGEVLIATQNQRRGEERSSWSSKQYSLWNRKKGSNNTTRCNWRRKKECSTKRNPVLSAQDLGRASPPQPDLGDDLSQNLNRSTPRRHPDRSNLGKLTRLLRNVHLEVFRRLLLFPALAVVDSLPRCSSALLDRVGIFLELLQTPLVGFAGEMCRESYWRGKVSRAGETSVRGHS